jgi:hypothetical protein
MDHGRLKLWYSYIATGVTIQKTATSEVLECSGFMTLFELPMLIIAYLL